MRLRPYIAGKDFEHIAHWLTDERTHAMWCANLIDYPIERANFEEVLRGAAIRYGDTPFVAINDDGEIVGFFSYSLNTGTNEGMIKCVMIAPRQRGKGYGKAMLQLAVKYAFEINKADAVQLNVFPENIRARKCYESVGFRVRSIVENAFDYQGESWGRCNMVIKVP